MKTCFVLAMVVLSACGESTEERICGAANGCGALALGDVEECIDALASVEAERALEECANCLEANTCAQISDGVCASTCSAVPLSSGSNGGVVGIPDSTKLRDLDQTEATELCHELADSDPKRSVGCTLGDGRGVTVVSGVDRANCPIVSAPASCNATVGQARDCHEALASISNLCDLTFPTVCEAVRGCNF